jgi:hypothetical protein
MQVTVPSIWNEPQVAIYRRAGACCYRRRTGGALRVHFRHNSYQLCVAGQDAHAEQSLPGLLCKDKVRSFTATLKSLIVRSLRVSHRTQYGISET